MNKTTPLNVSVLICTRDRSALLEGCLDSVVGCTPPPAEVIVVDQSCDDTTRAAIDRRPGSATPIRYVRGVGTGLSRARNQGIAACAAPVIAFTDDDCLVDPAWLEALTEQVRGGRADAAVGRTLPEVRDGGAQPTSSFYAPMGKPVFSRRTHPWRVGGGGNFAAGRDLLRRVGPYDERFGPGAPLESAEDMDLIHRLLRGGGLLVYSQKAVVWHRSWRTAPENRHQSRAYGIGAGAYFTKHFLAGDWISGWRFVERLAIRSIHMSIAVCTLDRRRITEQAIYVAALFEGVGRFLRSGGSNPAGVADLKQGAA